MDCIRIELSLQTEAVAGQAAEGIRIGNSSVSEHKGTVLQSKLRLYIYITGIALVAIRRM